MQEAKDGSYRDPESRRQYIKKIIRKILNNKNSKPRKEYEKKNIGKILNKKNQMCGPSPTKKKI